MCNCKHTAAEVERANKVPFNSSVVDINGKWLEIGLQDVEYMEKNFPETFSIPELGIRENLPVGIMAKVIVDWGIQDIPNERFWFEVTAIDADDEGNKVYFGVLRNDTIVAPWGAIMGPIYVWNICDVDVKEFMNRHAIGCSCNRCQQASIAA